MDIRFILIVPPNDDTLYNAWSSALDQHLLPDLRSRFMFLRRRLEDLPSDTRFDAIVSPANSYGRLDGAFDDAISRLFCPPDDYYLLTRYVQRELYNRWLGFAPPGSATAISLPQSIVEKQVGSTGCTHIIMCPTMHYPDDIQWHRDIVYNVIWSLLAEISRHNRENGVSSDSLTRPVPIKGILMPGMGTGVGRISPARFANQFALAVENFDEALRMPEWWSSMEWEDAERIYNALQKTVKLEERATN